MQDTAYTLRPNMMPLTSSYSSLHSTVSTLYTDRHSSSIQEALQLDSIIQSNCAVMFHQVLKSPSLQKKGAELASRVKSTEYGLQNRRTEHEIIITLIAILAYDSLSLWADIHRA